MTLGGKHPQKVGETDDGDIPEFLDLEHMSIASHD